jgi:hypothetical protein
MRYRKIEVVHEATLGEGEFHIQVCVSVQPQIASGPLKTGSQETGALDLCTFDSGEGPG